MKKRILIALALCMALGTACGKKEVEEEKTLRSVEVTRGILQANFPIPARQPLRRRFPLCLPFPARC